MNTGNITKIKLFISSTFQDMQKERMYLLNNIIPKLTIACNEKGLNLFCYDLRWGISEDEQQKIGTIKACLNAVDDSRPFFVGILGERYGWVPTEENDVLDSFGLHYSEKSITELEMLYGALDNENEGFCTFYLRDPLLSEIKETNPTRIKALNELKDRIRNSKYIYYDGYKNEKEFGDKLYIDFMNWLNKTFTETIDIEYNKQKAYQNSISRLPIGNREIEMNIISYLKENKNLYIVTDGEGINTMLNTNNVFKNNNEFNSIYVNLKTSIFLRKPYTIIKYILRRVRELYPNMVKIDCDCLSCEVSSEKDNEKLYSNFRICLENLKPIKPIYFFIMGIDLLESYIDKTLYWISSIMSSSIRFIVTTSERDFIDIMNMSLWHTRLINFTRESNILLFQEKLANYGKRISQLQLEKLVNDSTIFNDYNALELITNTLIDVVVFENLSSTIESIINFNTRHTPIPAICEEMFINNFSEEEQNAYYLSYLILKEMNYEIKEDDLYSCLQILLDIDSTMWQNLMTYSNAVFEKNNGSIVITNPLVKEYIEKYSESLNSISCKEVDEVLIHICHVKWERLKNEEDFQKSYMMNYYVNNYIKLVIKAKDEEKVNDLFMGKPYIILILIRNNPSLLRKLFITFESSSNVDLINDFNDNHLDLYNYFVNCEKEIGENLFFDLYTNVKAFDKKKILKNYPDFHYYNMSEKCSDEFVTEYRTLYQELFNIKSQQMLDTWYDKGSMFQRMYGSGNSIESVYVFKLLSLYAIQYSSTQYALDVLQYYFLFVSRYYLYYEYNACLYMYSYVVKKAHLNSTRSLEELDELIKKIKYETGNTEF